VDKISAMHLFDDGWEKVRERIFENQKQLGVIPANAKLPDWPDILPKWDSLSDDQKKLYLRQIDIWAWPTATMRLAASSPRSRSSANSTIR
jgi:arylsulfatase